MLENRKKIAQTIAMAEVGAVSTVIVAATAAAGSRQDRAVQINGDELRGSRSSFISSAPLVKCQQSASNVLAIKVSCAVTVVVVVHLALQ